MATEEPKVQTEAPPPASALAPALPPTPAPTSAPTPAPTSIPASTPAPEHVQAPKDTVVPVEKAVVSASEDKAHHDDSKALVPVDKVPEVVEEKASEGSKDKGGSKDRDVVLARVATEKRLSLVKAWEESEKSKADNKAQKKVSSILSWENSKKASIESELKKIEEKLEKKKAEYREKMQNKIAMIHKQAEEKRAMIEAQRGEELLKAEEIAAKYRATGTAPKKVLGCF